MKKSALVLMLGVLFFASCSSFFKVEVVIDNPSNELLSFYLDDSNYELAGKNHRYIRLVKGEHYLKAEQEGKVIYEGTLSITKPGIINLTQAKYVLHRELYLTEQEKYQELAREELNLKDVDIENKMYQNVDFEIFEETIFIPKQWDYDFLEPLPLEIKSGGDFKIVSKLYRQEDLEKAWGFNGNFDFTGNADVDLELFLDSIAEQLKTADSIY